MSISSVSLNLTTSYETRMASTSSLATTLVTNMVITDQAFMSTSSVQITPTSVQTTSETSYLSPLDSLHTPRYSDTTMTLINSSSTLEPNADINTLVSSTDLYSPAIPLTFVSLKASITSSEHSSDVSKTSLTSLPSLFDSILQASPEVTSSSNISLTDSSPFSISDLNAKATMESGSATLFFIEPSASSEQPSDFLTLESLETINGTKVFPTNTLENNDANITDALSLSDTYITNAWSLTQELSLLNTTLQEWETTHEIVSDNVTNSLETISSTELFPFESSSDWNSTTDTTYDTTNTTEIWNTTEETSTTTSETTTFTTTTPPTTTTETTSTTTTTTTTTTTLETTTEVPISEYHLTVPVIIGITVGLIALTALIFIMLLWRRKMKQDHSISVPRRYSVNSTKSSSFKHQSLYGHRRDDHHHHPGFAPVYYGDTNQNEDHIPIRMNSYKFKNGYPNSNPQTGNNFDQIKLKSRDSVSRADEVKKDNLNVRHSFPYVKRKSTKKLSKSERGTTEISSLESGKDNKIVDQNSNHTQDDKKEDSSKLNGYHDNNVILLSDTGNTLDIEQQTKL